MGVPEDTAVQTSLLHVEARSFRNRPDEAIRFALVDERGEEVSVLSHQSCEFGTVGWLLRRGSIWYITKNVCCIEKVPTVKRSMERLVNVVDEGLTYTFLG